MPKAWDGVGRSKLIIFPAALLPVGWLLYQAINNQLGPDPAKVLVDQLGLWALRFLWLSLAMTPLRLLSHKSFWIRYRRMFGLFAFFYASLHLFAYAVFLFELRWGALWQEMAERPYIIVGAAALVLMLPLAITSTRTWQRRLGRQWVRLHKVVYLSALLVLLHFTWVQKLGLWVTWPYAILLAVMLFIRIWSYFRRSVASAAIKR